MKKENTVLEILNTRLGRRNYVFGLIFSFLLATFFSGSLTGNYRGETLQMFISSFFMLLILFLTVRRTHDIGYSGKFLFFLLISLFLFDFLLILFVWAVLLISLIFIKGSKGANKYGESTDDQTIKEAIFVKSGLYVVGVIMGFLSLGVFLLT